MAIFSIGFVGAIAESIRALLIYACLLILFPVSVLLVEIILRLSASSPPVPVAAFSTPPTESLSTALPSTPKSTLIFSNSFTSNSLAGQPYSPSFSAERNLTANSASPPSALLPSPSFVSPSNEQRFNLSTRLPLPTDFYLLFKDGYFDGSSSSSHSLTKMLPPATSNHSEEVALPNDTGQAGTRKSTFLKATRNFWSNILTTSLSPRVETLVEYVLIGMLAFVLLQIGIAYLLASEIRTLRLELSMLTSMSFNKSDSELNEPDGPNLQVAETNFSSYDKEQLPSSAYCELQCYEAQPTQPTAGMPLHYASEHLSNFGPDFCLLTFQQPVPVVQVHANPDGGAPTMVEVAADEQGNSFNSNYVNVIIDETLANDKPLQFAKSSQFASTVSSSVLTSKTNRRNRMGSFRVTFDSAPEYFEAANDSFASEQLVSSALLGPAIDESASQEQQQLQQGGQPCSPEQQHQHQLQHQQPYYQS